MAICYSSHVPPRITWETKQSFCLKEKSHKELNIEFQRWLIKKSMDNSFNILSSSFLIKLCMWGEIKLEVYYET